MDDLRWACDKAVQECRYPIMPLPGVLIDFARAAPRRQIQENLNRAALDQTTSYGERLADESFQKIMAMFDDDWGLPSERRVAHEGIDTGEQRRA